MGILIEFIFGILAALVEALIGLILIPLQIIVEVIGGSIVFLVDTLLRGSAEAKRRRQERQAKKADSSKQEDKATDITENSPKLIRNSRMTQSQTGWFVLIFYGSLGVAFASWVGVEAWQRMKASSAKTLVQREAERWEQSVKENLELQLNAKPIDVNDPWGQPLEVSVEDAVLGKAIRVRSLGRDGVSGSRDDIDAFAFVAYSKRDAAKNIAELGKNKLIDELKKAFEKEK